MAINYSVSYTFTSGTTISSSQVNTNFSDNANTWNGVEAKTKTFSNVVVDTLLKSTGTVETAAGTFSLPSYTFTGDTDTGFYNSASNVLRVTAAGADVAIFKSTGIAIIGTTTNDAAAAGYVGEYIESVQTATSVPTSTQYGDLTSITLSAGDWDVSAASYFDRNGATWQLVTIGISITSGNSTTGLVFGSSQIEESWASTSTAVLEKGLVIPSYRMSVNGSTTVYFKMMATYSVATPQLRGRISARRVR